MATFSGQNLFGSGPSSVRYGRTGRLYLPAFIGGDNPSEFVIDFAKREVEVVQTGRLTASSASLLWSRIDAVRLVAEGTTEGTLVTDAGISLAGLTMLRFEPGEIEVGSLWSCAYECLYNRSGL